MSKENFLDRVIGWFSPRTAWERYMFRQGLNHLRNYDSARVDRLQPWTPINATAEQTDAPYRDILRARARDLERNSDLAEAAVAAIIRNVVGTGIRPQAKVLGPDGDYDEELNDRLEEEWHRWTRARHCDLTGQNTFYELQGLVLRRRIVDGEVFVRFVADRRARIPLKLQGLEADLLDTSLIKNEGNLIVSGVEVDRNYKPLAYWFGQSSPDGFVSLDSIRVPEDQVLHLFNRTRFTQIRGVSELARVIQRMKETGEYLDAELVAAKIAASFALFVRRQMPGGMVGRLPQEEGKRLDTIEPGMIEYLQPGEDIQVANPGRNASNVRDFVEIETRLAGAGMGLSYELLSRDMSKTNYSSARQNHLEDRRTFAPIQTYMVEHFCQPVWREFVVSSVLAGVVDIPDFWSDIDRYVACEWIAPGWAWVDPLKDVKASREELDAGFNTLSEICAEQGKDWQEVLRQRAREKKYAESLGLGLSNDDGKGAGAANADAKPKSQ